MIKKIETRVRNASGVGHWSVCLVFTFSQCCQQYGILPQNLSNLTLRSYFIQIHNRIHVKQTISSLYQQGNKNPQNKRRKNSYLVSLGIQKRVGTIRRVGITCGDVGTLSLGIPNQDYNRISAIGSQESTAGDPALSCGLNIICYYHLAQHKQRCYSWRAEGSFCIWLRPFPPCYFRCICFIRSKYVLGNNAVFSFSDQYSSIIIPLKYLLVFSNTVSIVVIFLIAHDSNVLDIFIFSTLNDLQSGRTRFPICRPLQTLYHILHHSYIYILSDWRILY